MTATLEVTHSFEASRAAGREPFKVRDLSLAALGRNEMRLAEHEMPVLMAVREKVSVYRMSGWARGCGARSMSASTSSAEMERSLAVRRMLMMTACA